MRVKNSRIPPEAVTRWLLERTCFLSKLSMKIRVNIALLSASDDNREINAKAADYLRDDFDAARFDQLLLRRYRGRVIHGPGRVIEVFFDGTIASIATRH